MTVRRQLQRLPWQHGCSDPERLAGEIWEPGSCGGWVFANPVGGPTDPRADARDFKALCAKAGVPPKRLHDLCHSAANMMLASDLDLRIDGQVLG